MKLTQKKKWKTILIAGILTGLTAVYPVYGADFILSGANRIVRVGEDGKTTSYTPGNSLSSDSEQPILEPGFSQTETQDTQQNTELTDQQPEQQNTQQEDSQPQDSNTQITEENQPDQPQAEQQNTQLQDSQPQDLNTQITEENQTEQPQPEQPSANQEELQQPEEPQPQQPAEEPEVPAEPEQPQQDLNLLAGIRALDPSKPMIALTYDDGPYAPVGNRIMNIMNQYGGKCTFFMVGNRVASFADEVRRMANEGFEVANHTQDHKNLSKTSAAQIQAQVTACNDIIQTICGIRPTLMRLPGGNKNSTVLASTGMPMIMWNIDTLDWKTRNAQSTINSVLGKVKDGDIILMHELYTATAEATESLVPALTAQGFQLVTVSELAYYKGTPLNAGQLYYSIR